MNDLLDDLNRKLIAELAGEPQLTRAELARRVNLSPPAVGERLARLEEAQVITRRVDIDATALGLPLAAWVRVRPAARQLPKIAELAKELPEVVLCDRISGEDCFLLKLHARSMEHLEEVLDQFLLFGQTTSSFVVASPVPLRPLDVERLED